MTMSEFGRTAQQNGTGGTDHGHANVMFVLGGAVKGGKVYGKWPGMATEQLNQSRDLAITTDFRQVLGEAAYQDSGSAQPGAGFPRVTIEDHAVSESSVGLMLDCRDPTRSLCQMGNRDSRLNETLQAESKSGGLRRCRRLWEL